MNKARKKFVLYAMLSVFALLGVLLGVINGINFTMASEDADMVTQRLSEDQGMFQLRENAFMNRQAFDQRSGLPLRTGPMGPDSPETAHSMRYFTFAFDGDGAAEKIAMQISAVSEEEAESWARSLLDEQETGWTAGTYRYRVYQIEDKTFVTVIDQGRELVSCYRILYISLAGLVIGMAVSCAALMFIGKRLFKPLEDADRKQKRFISEVEKEFKAPLTVINANTELIERRGGESEETAVINRQVRRMISLVRDLASLRVFDDGAASTRFDLSALVRAAADAGRQRLTEKGVVMKLNAQDEVYMTGDSDVMSDLVVEIIDNAVKFAEGWFNLSVTQSNGRVSLTASNGTKLPSGSVDQVFDRFTRLENADGASGVGLGLSHVKEIVRAYNGRVSAKVSDGAFILTILL